MAPMNDSLFELPLPSTDLSGAIELHDSGATVTLSFPFMGLGEKRQTTTISFAKVRAYRHRAESHCTAEQIESAYDTLIEISDSEWIAQLRSDTSAHKRAFWKMRHFRIFADSGGCYEFIAEAWSAS